MGTKALLNLEKSQAWEREGKGAGRQPHPRVLGRATLPKKVLGWGAEERQGLKLGSCCFQKLL